MRLLCAAALIAFGLGLVPSRARADALPPPPPPRDVKFKVELDEKAKAPKLIVPPGLTVARVRPRPGPGNPPVGKEPLAYLEVESDEPTPTDAPRNPNHLMIAGVALTLALGLGGVWLVRRPGRTATRGLVLLLAAGGTLAASTVVWGNVPPPVGPSGPPTPKKEVVALPIAFDGNVTLEFAGRDTIRLVLDKETYEKMKKEPKAPDAK